MKKSLVLLSTFLLTGVFSFSQSEKTGNISGNFQTDAQYYLTDTIIGAESPAEKTLINSYANFTYLRLFLDGITKLIINFE